MAALTWTTLQTELQAIIARTPYPYTVVDGAFSTLFPQATSYAEQRIYHDIPMLAQKAQDTSLTTTAGVRSVNLSGTALPAIVPERLALLTPAGATLANGAQIVAEPASLDFMDMFWPQQSQTQAPDQAPAIYWCLRDDQTAIVAPTPDAAYTVVLTGLFQQTPISAGNPTTYLATNYPELMTAACMVFISGALLRNYGSQGAPSPDEPGMSVSWESQYITLKGIAQAEELRRRQLGTDWLDRPPMPAPPVKAIP